MIRPRLLLLALFVALAGAAAPAGAATYTDLAQFRMDAHGREVTWDDQNGPVAADVYKDQGLVLSTGGNVSGGVFQPSSSPITGTFVVPGSSTTALVRGFGVVFPSPTASSKLELLDAKGQVLASAQPESGNFVGILLSDGRVAKVRITGAPLDNLLYAEPMQDIDGDGVAENDPDADGDGIPNERDAFPLDKKESVDTDGDGIGDNKDTDDDNDGVPDTIEGRRGTDPKRVDTDGDGVGDGQDNCPITPNPDQADGNADGQGDACSDLVPPTLGSLALRPAKFRTGSKNGTRVSFRLSEPATVELRVLRVAGARRPPLPGTIERQATAGVNFVRFSGRIGGHDLKPGHYVLLATAEDAAGNVAFQAPRARFTVVR